MLKCTFYLLFIVCVALPAIAQQEPGTSDERSLLSLSTGMGDTSHVDLLLRISERFFSRLGRQKKDLDSSFLYVLSAKALSTKLNYQRGLGNSYRQLSKIFLAEKDTIKGKTFNKKAIETFTANNDLMELGEAWFDFTAYYSLYTDGLTERIHIAEKSRSVFTQAGSKRKEADVLKELGDLRFNQGDFNGALSDLKKALQLYQSIGYPRLQGTYDLMGTITASMGDFEHALQYGLLALKTAEQVKDTTMQKATIYNRIGTTYERLNKYQLAFDYYQNALSIAKKYDEIETIIILSTNIAKVLNLLDKPREAITILQHVSNTYPERSDFSQLLITSRFLSSYTALKMYKEGQRYCDQQLLLSKKMNQTIPEQILVYAVAAQFYLATHQYAQAHRYLAINEAFLANSHMPLNLATNHFWWFKLDSTQGNYLSAILHYQQYKVIGDSLLNEATSNQIEQLQIQFETEKKDQDIQLKENNIQLLTRQALLQKNELQQAWLVKNFTLAAIALLLIILTLLYNHSRHKLKSHKQLEAQQREIQTKNISLERLVKEKDWLVKEIHHRVKNNFHTVMGLLGTQSSYLKNEEALIAISESQHRIHAMSLIHQKLYQSESFSAVNMPDYISELVEYLKDSFDIHLNIRFSLHIEPVELDLAHAVPLGLILNEAITNSIKYAFSGRKEGHIIIRLKHLNEEQILLTIADDGIGVPIGFDPYKRASMGMNLMQGLSEEIGGIFVVKNDGGTAVEIVFTYDPEPAHPQNSINYIQPDYA